MVTIRWGDVYREFSPVLDMWYDRVDGELPEAGMEMFYFGNRLPRANPLTHKHQAANILLLTIASASNSFPCGCIQGGTMHPEQKGQVAFATY